jgi:predicted methyltransferase
MFHFVSKSAKKKKGKNIHQQLNKIFEKEKRDKKSGNLMDFLSTL